MSQQLTVRGYSSYCGALIFEAMRCNDLSFSLFGLFLFFLFAARSSSEEYCKGGSAVGSQRQRFVALVVACVRQHVATPWRRAVPHWFDPSLSFPPKVSRRVIRVSGVARLAVTRSFHEVAFALCMPTLVPTTPIKDCTVGA